MKKILRKTMAFILSALMILVMLPVQTVLAVDSEYITYYSTVDFGDASTLTTQGAVNSTSNDNVVSVSSGSLILTPAGEYYTGSAFFNKKSNSRMASALISTSPLQTGIMT